MTQSPQRIHYYDVAKGILILLVVIHHIPQVVKVCLCVDDGIWRDVRGFNFLYACYFMPAFFLISGACSNFNRPFIDFLKRTLLGILLPSFLLPILTIWIINILSLNFHLSSYGIPRIKHFLLWGPSGWFLAALFLSRLIYWTILHFITKIKYRLSVCLLLLVLACLLNQFDLFPNYWYHRHSLALVIFIAAGHWFRQVQKKKYYLFAGAGFFILLTVLLQVGGFEYCWITNAFHVNLFQIPLLLMMGISGSCLILCLAQLVDKCSIIEYLGRNTLFIYVFQWDFLCWIVMRFQGTILSANYSLSVVLFVVFFLATIVFSSIISLLLNTRYLRFFLGKF